MSTYSGLSEANAAVARRVFVAAAEVCMANQSQLHYTKGAQRWQGIDQRVIVAEAKRGPAPRPYGRQATLFTVHKTGHMLTYGDCSSTGTWMMWHALYRTFRLPDRVNGVGWTGGYTGTLLSHGRRVSGTGNLKVGDAIIYGSGDGDHVSWSLGGNRAFSHGSEAGPFIIDATAYRAGEILGIRRYI